MCGKGNNARGNKVLLPLAAIQNIVASDGCTTKIVKEIFF